jgi:hypothetical protein
MAGDMKRKRHRVLPERGDPCPRCGRATETHEHIEVTAKHLRQAYYYRRWFRCTNPDCRTTLIMPDRYRVFRWEQPVSRTADDTPTEQTGNPPWED